MPPRKNAAVLTSPPAGARTSPIALAQNATLHRLLAGAQPAVFHGSVYRGTGGNRLAGFGATAALYAVAGALAWAFLADTRSTVAPLPATLVSIAITAPPHPKSPDKPPARVSPRPVQRAVPAHTPAPTPERVPLTSPLVAAPPQPDEPAQPVETPQPTAAVPAPAPAQISAMPVGPDTWQGRVLARLAMRRHYPATARASHEQGVPTIRFTMDRAGRVLSATLARSSGFSDLDSEALALPARAQPLPKPPAELRGETLELLVPVEFSLH